MKRINFPASFIVGSDILKSFSDHTSCFGNKYVFIGGERSLKAARPSLEESFKGTSAKCTYIPCGKVCCDSEINRIGEIKELKEADIIVGVGGGSCMDVTRTRANREKKTLIMIVTTPSSDAPCTNVSVIYAEDGHRVAYDLQFPKCPDMVMVDSKVIANAPVRLLAAGMGDALTTWYEGKTGKQNPSGTNITRTASALCSLCRDIIFEDGLAAYRSVKAKSVTPQLESVIEANCFLSGIGALNSNGTVCAHGLGDWLVSVPGGENFMHGERVFAGLIVQTVLEEYPLEETLKLMRFGREVGLPVCVGDLGVTDTAAVAKKAGIELQNDHFMVNLCCDRSPDKVEGAINYVQYLADNCL
ncbi:MAG: iron-containing alcohol dehydrogenase [Eubacterium sp.]|nr:iron-containing alcohol dehydrogenase [Eubacterium sp.]